MYGVCSGYVRGMFGVCTGYVYFLDAVCICAFNAAECSPEPFGAYYGRLPLHYAKPLHHADGCGAGALCNNARGPSFSKMFVGFCSLATPGDLGRSLNCLQRLKYAQRRYKRQEWNSASLRPPASSTKRSKHFIVASTSASLSKRFLPRPPRGSSCATARVIVDFARRRRRAISEGATLSSLYQSFARRSSSEESGEPGMLRNGGATDDSLSQNYIDGCQRNAFHANG